MKHLGDITKVNGAEIEPVDCITFGSPCQDLSIAGKRAGLAGERSGLFMEAVRIIKEMRGNTDGVYPTFAVWENVAGAFSSNKGEDFRAVLEELAQIVEPEAVIPGPEKKWQHSGFVCGDDWSIAWRLLDAQYWGVPQRRKRIALVVDLGGQRAGEILFECEGLPGNSEPSIPAWKNSAASPKDRAGAGCGESRNGVDAYGFPLGFRPENTRVYRQMGTTICNGTRPGFTNGVCYSIQGAGLTSQNSQGSGINEGVCFTLNALDTHGVAYAIDSLSSNSMKSSNPNSGFHATDKAKTLDCTGPDPTKNQGGVAICQAYAIDCRNATINPDVNGTLQSKEGGGYNLNTNNVVMQPAPYQDKTGCLSPGAHAGSYNGQDAYNDMLITCNNAKPSVYDARGNGDGKTVPTLTGDHERSLTDYTAVVVEPQIRWIVRRLTPLECERLQGFPDNWTLIGEWTDSKGKKHKEADTPRYKALGNSIALPQWWWLTQKMKPYLPDHAKLGSLFDGIGGFPLVWETGYGEGTARWASEIEEFPIAVTKYHFPEEDVPDE